MQKHGWHRKYEVYKDTQQKFLVKHIHPFKIISRALIRDLIYALWLCLSRKSFCLTFPVLLSQNFWWFWASFAESIRMCDNHGGHPHGQKGKLQFCTTVCRALCCWKWCSPGLCQASPSGWSFRCTSVTVPSAAAWGEAVQCQVLSKHLLVSHSKLPSSLSGSYHLLPRRCPLLELYMIAWYVVPNVSPG